MRDIKKRKILKLLPLSILGSLYACNRDTNVKNSNTKDLTEEKIHLKMVTSFPKNLPGSDIPAQRLANKIQTMSQGQIRIKHYAAGELVPALEVFDAVSSGTIECGVSAPFYWGSKHKAIPFFCSVPGGMTAREIFSWLIHFDGQELWDNLYSSFNLKGLPMGETGTTMGGWYNKEINKITDFSGIKMRIPGLGAEVASRLGVTALNVPGNEVINSLKLGIIDAAEWAGPWPDRAMGFHKVAKYYYGPGIHEPSTLNEFIINKNIWESLPLNLQEIIKNACYSNYIEGLSESFSNNARTLKLLKNESNIKIRNFSNKIVKEMLKVSYDVVKENTKINSDYRTIFNSWRSTIQLFNDYHNYSEKKYLDYRIGAFKG